MMFYKYWKYSYLYVLQVNLQVVVEVFQWIFFTKQIELTKTRIVINNCSGMHTFVQA